MIAAVRVGGRIVSADDVFRVTITVHPLEQDDEAAEGLYEIADIHGQRTVSYLSMRTRLLDVAKRAKPSLDPEQWVENQVARLLGLRRLFVIISTGEAYT